MIDFFKYRKISYIASLSLILASVIVILLFGLNLGIEFTGGTVMEIEYPGAETSQIRSSLTELGLGEVTVQPLDNDEFIIKMADLNQEEYRLVREALQGSKENSFESIGPTIGKELKDKALLSIILSSLAIMIYITITFSGTGGKKVKSWQYGAIAAGLGFLHDILILLGMFALIGKTHNVQTTIPIAIALLTVLGYSINDTVVIFDRIRENTLNNPKLSFSQVVNKSINETLSRSINTSLTTLLALLAVLFFGGETLHWFILTMITGIIIGTYSSVFLAGPLLVSWSEKNKNV